MSNALRVLGWSPGKLDLLKGTRRLPRVDLFGSGCDNFIGIRAPVFQMVFESFSESSGYRLYFCPCIVCFKLNTCFFLRR